MFCIMCLHLASQFRILQYRLVNLSSVENKEEVDNEENMDSSGRCYAILKNCIRQHQALIQFSITLEEIFTIITLGQVLIFSTLICFVGYQVLLVSYYYNFLFYWKFLQFFQFKFNILLLNNFLGAVNTFYLREKLLLYFLFLPVSHCIFISSRKFSLIP